MIPVVLLFLLPAGFLFAYRACSERNVLAERYTGTPEQDRTVAARLSDSFLPEQGISGRLAAIHRWHPVLAKMPKEKRQTMLVCSMLDATDRSLNALGACSGKDRSARIALLRRDAEDTYAFFRKLPKEKQNRVRELLKSPAAEEPIRRVHRTLAAGLSPEDREALAPVILLWNNMLSE